MKMWAMKPGSVVFGLAILAAAATVGTGQTPGNPGFTRPTAGTSAAPGDGSSENPVAPVLPTGWVAAQSPAGPSIGAAGDMIGFSGSDASGTQTITLVHTGKSWMAVYHIDRSGQIRLVSSRPIDADFSLQLNATSPLPDEIRKLGRR